MNRNQFLWKKKFRNFFLKTKHSNRCTTKEKKSKNKGKEILIKKKKNENMKQWQGFCKGTTTKIVGCLKIKEN